MDSCLSQKKRVGYLAAEMVENGMHIGVGTGSTVFFFIERLIERMQKEHLNLRAAPTSRQTALLLQKGSITLIEDQKIEKLDLSVDGADQLTENFHLIKGGGGALLREKIIAQASERYIIIADKSKWRTTLSGKIPIEVSFFGLASTIKALEMLGPVSLRKKEDHLFISDNGNPILDLTLDKIGNIVELDHQLHHIAGVLSTGLFYNLPNPSLIMQ